MRKGFLAFDGSRDVQMAEIREVAAGRHLGESSSGDRDGDGVVSVEDRADVALGEISF